MDLSGIAILLTQIVDRTEIQSTKRTGHHAYRLQALIKALFAGVALDRMAELAADLGRIVGACHDAIPAADAFAVVHEHQTTLLFFMHRSGRAYAHACRIVTMVAGHRKMVEQTVRRIRAIRIRLPGASLKVVDLSIGDIERSVHALQS